MALVWSPRVPGHDDVPAVVEQCREAVQALLFERAGYEARGLPDSAAEVEAAIGSVLKHFGPETARAVLEGFGLWQEGVAVAEGEEGEITGDGEGDPLEPIEPGGDEPADDDEQGEGDDGGEPADPDAAPEIPKRGRGRKTEE